MLDHAQVYRDFYQFTPPGTDLVYFGLFRVLGTHLWVTNAFVLVLGVALCWMCFSIAREMMSRMAALCATALFLVLIYCKLLNGTHHWLSVLCVMGAVKIRMKSASLASTLAIGALLGLASSFTQTRGVAALVAFTFFLIWRQWRIWRPWTRIWRPRIKVLKDICLLLSGFLASWLLFNAYFIVTVGLRSIWYFQVIHVQRYILAAVAPPLGLPEQLVWHNLPKLAPYLAVYLLLAIIYPMSLWNVWKNRESAGPVWERTALLVVVGLSLLAEVAFSPNWLRLYSISISAFILLGWYLCAVRKVSWCIPTLLWAGILCVAAWQTASRYLHQPLVVTLPGGTVAMSPEEYVKLHWLAERTKPGDFLFQAAWPGVYLPLGLRDPSYLETVVPFDGPRPEDVKRVPWELESKRVRFVLWSPGLDAANAEAPSVDDFLPLLRGYLRQCYAPVHSFADEDEVWQRKETGECSGWTRPSPAEP